MTKNSIRLLIDKHPEIEVPIKDIFSEIGIKWLKSVELPGFEGKILKEDIKLLVCA
ncbi:MAG: hypothetical protein QMD71_09020 [bacterium]|nr:hypothetical protein [bacterium]